MYNKDILSAPATQTYSAKTVTFKEIASSNQKEIRLSHEVCAQLKQLGLTLDSSVDFDSNGLLFEPGVYLCEGCSLDRPCIGAYSYSSINTSLTTVKVGRFCSIGHGVEFGLYEHPLHHVTTSPALSRNIFFMERSGAIPFNHQLRPDGLETNVVTLGHVVWVGGHCLFPKEVTIGHGAVIGAGSIITHDVPPYAIVAGTGGGSNSHGIIRGYRFPDEIISDLLEINWWDYDLPKMVASGIKVPTTDIKDFILFMKNEERERLIPLISTWYYLNAIDSQIVEVYRVDPEQTFLGNAISPARIAIINDPEYGSAPIQLKRQYRYPK